jgi:YD repeat-containing protein
MIKPDMRLTRKLSFILLLALLSNGMVKSQAPANPGLEIARNQFHAKQVIPPSPEASELGKYGNIPISLFTGTPNISIPLLELKGNFLFLPVSLSYNSSGFKPEDIAPWTGLGWSLNAGGVITRSVLGDPDMADNYFRPLSPIRPIPSDEYLKQLYYDSVRNRYLETQGDIYYYNFMGHSGRFMIRTDGTIVEKEKNYFTVTCSTSPTVSSNWTFTITDEKGFIYEFTDIERTLITPVDDEPNAPPMTSREFYSTWYLSKVTAPNGLEELIFEYWSPAYAQSTYGGALTNNSVTFTKSRVVCDPDGDWPFDPLSSNMYYFHHPATGIYKKFIKKITLKKNIVTIGYIDFESDLNARVDLGDADFDGERMLKKVKLYNTTNSVNTLVQEFVLGYAYFGISQSEAPGFYRRLMLKSVREMSTDSTLTPNKPPYTFHYNAEASTMPGRFTSGLDHWGYYNGAANTYGSSPNLIPTVAVTGMDWVTGNQGLDANREPNMTYAKYTVLERIDYPTGGYTTFDYEGNAAIYGGPSVLSIGGLRIKEMVDYSFANKAATVKRYEYLKEDGSSSGIIATLPNYWSTMHWADQRGICVCDNPFVRETWNATISASSTFGLGTIQGSHIGYSRVTEYQTDLATGKPLGKTAYAYDFQNSNEVDYHIGNGELLKQQIFDNGDKLLNEVTNTYTYEDFDSYRGIVRKLLGFTETSDATTLYRKITGTDTFYLYGSPVACEDPPSGYGALMINVAQNYFVENYMTQQRKKLSMQVSKVYDGFTKQYVSYTKNFTYGNADHNYPTLIEETDSKSDKVFTSIKYVADYATSCSPSAQSGSMAAAIIDLKSKNMMGLPVEKLQYRDNISGTNRRYINGEIIQYKIGLPEKIYYLQASPMPTSVTASTASCTTTQSIDNNYRLAATMSYDSYMNLTEESKTDDAVTTYLWGYNNRYPVAKVSGKTLSECLATGISQSALTTASSESAIRTELNKLRTLSEALVSTYTYQPMVGMISAKDARGQLITYEYDALNRLVNIKDSNEIVKNFRYNYGLGTAPDTSIKSLYYNAALEQTYTKAGCSLPQYGETIVYKVPYGKYAAISQVDADNLGAADLAANGQLYANLAGSCGWKNAALNQTVYKATCTYEQGPPVGINYNVPFGKYFSLISQADADARATAEVTALGQAYANENDICSCMNEGKKYINGTCETGTKINAGSSYENGQWVCSYYYLWSDSSTSGYYYAYQSEPCPIDP